jgi:putative ABC transport system permease protein
MSWVRRILNTLRPGLQKEIDREISFHIAERTDELRRNGLADDDARRRARLQFGNPSVQRERTRDVDVAGWIDLTMRNLRYAVRTMRHAPGFSVAVVLTLALGIGANTAVFSAIDAILLRPLPFPDGDRLMRLTQVQEGSAVPRIAPTRIEDWNRLNTTFEAITGYYTDDVVMMNRDVPERFHRALVGPRFVEVLGVTPAMGRGFNDAEHRYGGPVAVMISDRYWRNYRSADPRVLDQPLRLGTASITTAGVMAPAFQFPTRDVDVWSPVADAPWTQPRTLTWYNGLGRLRAGVSVAQAQADLDRVQAELARQYPDTDRGIRVRVEPLKEAVVGDSRASLWLLFGSVSVLLLIACTNIAALLLSRAVKRQQEITVRYSLGGSRRAVVAQLLTEVAVLASCGAAVGIVVALGASRGLRILAPELPRIQEVGIDGRILLYTAASTILVALLCGLAPAIRGTRTKATLSPSTRTHTSTRHSLQWLLVGVQVALSVTLLAGAGLLLRSVDALSRVNHGFDPARVLTLRVSGTYGTETTGDAVRRINAVLDRLDQHPDVEAAAITSAFPGLADLDPVEFALAEGRDAASPRLLAENRIVSPGYFAAMSIPVLSGELCRRSADAGDRTGVTVETVVNRQFVDRYFQGRPVVGLHLEGGLRRIVENKHLAGAAPSRVVGIVGNARELGADREPPPTVYTCFSAPNPAPWHAIRTTGEPMAAVASIRRAINEVEPRRSVYDIAPLEQRTSEASAQNRLRTWLLSLFAMTALALVCAGVYGTLSYAVTLRRREVALRLALGALRWSIVRQLVGGSLRVVAVAAACGLVLALIFTRSLSTMLYGVTPNDPATLAAVLAVVIAVAGTAAVVPAARAAFVQPMRALRED